MRFRRRRASTSTRGLRRSTKLIRRRVSLCRVDASSRKCRFASLASEESSRYERLPRGGWATTDAENAGVGCNNSGMNERSGPEMDRRRFLGVGAAALLSGASGFSQGVGGGAKARLILLGTGGGPTPKKGRSACAQVIVVNGAAYVVDCGNGVARQLVSAGIKLGSIRDVFITHHHSDHNADY